MVVPTTFVYILGTFFHQSTTGPWDLTSKGQIIHFFSYFWENSLLSATLGLFFPFYHQNGCAHQFNSIGLVSCKILILSVGIARRKRGVRGGFKTRPGNPVDATPPIQALGGKGLLVSELVSELVSYKATPRPARWAWQKNVKVCNFFHFRGFTPPTPQIVDVFIQIF